jgi:hypothetical protein
MKRSRSSYSSVPWLLSHLLLTVVGAVVIQNELMAQLDAPVSGTSDAGATREDDYELHLLDEKPNDRTCPEGCEKRGNCDQELGRCALGGTACQPA